MSNDVSKRRTALLTFKFVGTALIGSLTMALVSTLAPAPAQLAVLGALVSILGGLFVKFLEQEDERERKRNELVERLSVPLALASEPELYGQYLALCRGLTVLSRQDDPVLREITVLKLASLVSQVECLADGVVIFHATETWRAVYEKLLRSPDIKEYQSVAWVRTTQYWQDPPGRQSMQVNFDAVRRGVLIERVLILRDDLWPRGQLLPSDDILPWVQKQHDHGLWLCLVRESDLASEGELLADTGVYGDRAMGVQELDERCRTLRFSLYFDPQAIRLAKDRWQRLLVYSVPFRDLLDQADTPA